MSFLGGLHTYSTTFSIHNKLSIDPTTDCGQNISPMNLQLSWQSGGNAICQGKMTSKTTQNAMEETRKAVAYFSPLSQKKWKKKNYKRGKNSVFELWH